MSEKEPFKPYIAFSNDEIFSTGGGEPPGGDQLEARVKKVEDDLKEIKGDMKSLLKDVSEMKGRLSAMPTTFQLLGMVLAIMGATFAFIRFGLSVTPTP